MNIAAFDIDGVLLQAFQFGPMFQAKYGISDSEMATFWEELFPPCVLGRSDLKGILSEKLEHWNVPLSPCEVCHSWFKRDGEIIQSGITLLEECRSHYDFLIITSTQEQYRADYIKSQYDFMRHVDRTFFSCEVGLKKPDAEYFQHVEASLTSTSITLFDDSSVNVHAAIACGWKGYHYTGESSLKEFLT